MKERKKMTNLHERRAEKQQQQQQQQQQLPARRRGENWNELKYKLKRKNNRTKKQQKWGRSVGRCDATDAVIFSSTL